MVQILVPIREALRKLGAASAVTFAVRRERLDVGGVNIDPWLDIV
jgi:hypothetical protein